MMKVTKKNILLLGLTMLSGIDIQSQIPMFEKVASKEEILKGLEQAYSDFSSPGGASIISKGEWNLALGRLQQYVKKNAQGNSKLLNASDAIVKVAEDLAKRASEGPMAVSPNFAENVRNFENAINALKSDIFWWGLKKEVRDFLIKIADNFVKPKIPREMRDIYPGEFFGPVGY